MKKIQIYLKVIILVDLYYMGSNYMILAAVNGGVQGHGS